MSGSGGSTSFSSSSTRGMHRPAGQDFRHGGRSGRRTLEGRLDQARAWRAEHEWPLARTAWTPFYLHADGALRPSAPLDRISRHASRSIRRPVSNHRGGTQSSLLAGFIQGRLRSARKAGAVGVPRPASTAERADVVVFQTPRSPRRRSHRPDRVRLWVATSAVDTDFTVKLVTCIRHRRLPDGYALNLTDGILRLRFRRSWSPPSLSRLAKSARSRSSAGHEHRFVAGTASGSTSPAATSRASSQSQHREPLGQHGA